MIISEIKLDNSFKGYLDREKKQLSTISWLSKINIFVWANNSWKSRFMRELWKIKDIQFKIWDSETKNFLSIAHAITKEFSIIFENNKKWIAQGSIWWSQITKDTDINSMIPHYLTSKTIEDIRKIKMFIEWFDSVIISSYYGNGNVQQVIAQEWSMKKANNKELSNNIELIKNFKFDSQPWKRVYIPILSSLNCLDEYLTNKDIDIFGNRIQKIYSLSDWWMTVFTGQTLYKSIKAMLLWDKNERLKIRKFEHFLQEKLFDGKEITLIPKEKDDVIHVSIWWFEKPIYNLWDGIQTIIILSFLFFTEDNGCFFIEEPEQNLHPWMQRKLIDVMFEFPNHQYFLTTHSNHFLDLTLDYNEISIYRLNGLEDDGEQKFIIEQVESWDSSILRSLGVKNSSVFLSNCTIRVEWITDRLYIKRYLELYQKAHENIKQVIEDIDFSFVEYGWWNITHRSFLEDYSTTDTIEVKRLCWKLMLIADNDNDKAKERKKILKEKLWNNFIQLPCIEIENTLSLDTIKEVIKEYEWPTVIFANTKADLKKTQIWIYIEKNLLKNKFIRTWWYKDKSWTIKAKVAFCQKAISYLNDYNRLSTPAKVLTQKVYNFILEQKIN